MKRQLRHAFMWCVDTPPAGEDGGTGGGGGPQEGQPEAKFTQADIDRIVRERVARAKPADYDDLKAKAGQFDQLTAKQKTTEQQTADRIAELERQLADSASAQARVALAAEHGVDKDHAQLIGQGTADEMAANAALVGALLKDRAELAKVKTELEQTKTAKAPSRLSAAHLRGGASGANDNTKPAGSAGLAEAQRRFGIKPN